MSPICKQCGTDVPYLVRYQQRECCPACADKNAAKKDLEDSERNSKILSVLRAHPLTGISRLLSLLKEQGLIVPQTTLWELLNSDGKTTLKGVKKSGTNYFVEE